MEPMYAIFRKHDTDQDGYLLRGEVKKALGAAGIAVVDEDLAFEWLDRYFENRLSYKEFRRAAEKAKVVCPACHYKTHDSDSENE